jgi:hypothetical protein
MSSIDVERATSGHHRRGPQGIDRHDGAIHSLPNTPVIKPASVGWREILRDLQELRAELKMVRAELEALKAAAAYCEMCGSSPCINPGFCANCRRIEQEQPRQPPSPGAPRPTPQTVVEAVLHCVRERGIVALHEPANLERLSRCDAAARQQINARIDKMLGGAR